MVGINADRLSSYPHELSGGMRQRVMIAMALALEPQVVILDEPTTALDVVTQREILEELTVLRERLGFAVLFITHDLSLLVEIADSIAVMYAGRLVERAAAARTLPRPAAPVHGRAAELVPGAARPAPVHDRHPRLSPDLRMLPVGCVFHPRCRVRDGHLPRAVPAAASSPPAQRPTGWPPAGCRTAPGRCPRNWPSPSQAPHPGPAAPPPAPSTAAPSPGTRPPGTPAGQLAPSIAAPEQGSQS